jgi:hypothetical protein
MKKVLLSVSVIMILLTGCQTQEEINIKKEKERIEGITKEVESNTEIPEEAKTWMIDNKSTQVLTILCIKTSKRCSTLKEELSKNELNIKNYYIDIDELDDKVKNVYKNTYELDSYTGYLPYVILVDNDKLIATKSNVNNIDDIKSFLEENKIVSE